MADWRGRGTGSHWLDAIGDFLLNEWIRELIADQNLEPNQRKKAVYNHYEANENSRIKIRLDGILAQIHKQENDISTMPGAKTSETENKDEKTENKNADSDFLTIKEKYDALTPSDYLKKQALLLNSNDYKNIQSIFELQIKTLLENNKYKTNQELTEECKRNDCVKINGNVLQHCPSVQRMKVVLEIYYRLMKCEALWRRIPIGPIMTYHLQNSDKTIDIKYGHLQIFEDFLHIKDHLDNEDEKNIAKTLCQYFERTYPCTDISKCHAFSRHFRDRGNIEKEKEMFHYIEACSDVDDSMKTVQIRQEIELIFQEECDKIHCNFLHSVYQFENDAKDETKSNDRIDDVNKYGAGRSWEQTEQQKESIAEKKEEKKPIKGKKGYVGKKEDEKWLEKFEEVKNEEDGYKLLVKHMGIFRWQCAHGFSVGQYQGLAHLKCTFKNIKEEALRNSYSKASKDNWNQTLRKSKIFYQSYARNRIKTLYAGSFDDRVTDTNIKWKRGQEISLQEIVMLKLYTDFDKLQHELKKCFRWESIRPVLQKMDQNKPDNDDDDDEDNNDDGDDGDDNDDDNNDNNNDNNDDNNNDDEKSKVDDDYDTRTDLKNRLREFWHWRVGLLSILYKYGKKINEENMVLYHGVNAKMILNPVATMAFYGPLSTTSSYHVAKTFATAKGMVLKITSQYPRLDHCRAFDASVISDYPEEQEHLIGFIYMRVLEIRTRPIVNDIKNKVLWASAPLPSKIRVVFFAVHLFHQQMFSMSEHLEYYIVEFLKCHQMACCEQHKIKQLREDKKESFLSFLCCEVACHPKALTKPQDWKHRDPIETKIMKILWTRFGMFQSQPNTKQVIKIDQISNRLKPFFLKLDQQTDVHGNDKWSVSFTKLLNIFPNIQEIHYINSYRFDNEAFKRLLDVLKNGKTNLHTIRFVYYNYKHEKNESGKALDYPTIGDSFFHPDGLDKGLIKKLEDNHNWTIQFNVNGKIGFKIRLFKSKEIKTTEPTEQKSN